MSVLDEPSQPVVVPATRIANQLVQQTRNTFQQLVQAFNAGAEVFWRNPRATPEEISAALGTNAREVFELHGKIGRLLAEVRPAAIVPGMAVVGQFTYNEDGTVTVVQPEPEPAAPAE